MEISGVHHVSINVRDISVAEKFYVNVLGLDVLPRPDFGFGGLWLALGMQQLHLVESDNVAAPTGAHFAVQVAGIDRAISDLRELGVEVGDAFPIPSPTSEGALIGRQAFVSDPDGNLIELHEVTT